MFSHFGFKGKPSPLLLEIIMRDHNLDPNLTVMIGDRLDTDIAFGQAGGLSTILVLSGVTKEEEVLKNSENGGIKPSLVLRSVAEIAPNSAS